MLIIPMFAQLSLPPPTQVISYGPVLFLVAIILLVVAMYFVTRLGLVKPTYERSIRLLVGGLLLLSLLQPFGVYHTETEPYIIGTLWAFMLPAWYINLVPAALLLLYWKLRIQRFIDLRPLLILSGITIISTVMSLTPLVLEPSLNLWHGIQAHYDIEGRPLLLFPFSFYIGVFSIFLGATLSHKGKDLTMGY